MRLYSDHKPLRDLQEAVGLMQNCMSGSEEHVKVYQGKVPQVSRLPDPYTIAHPIRSAECPP